MSRTIELVQLLHAYLDEVKANPSDDPAVIAEREARGKALMTELAEDMNAETRRLNAETARMQAETAAMNQRAKLLRIKAAEVNELTARAKRGELSREEARMALLHYAMLNDAAGLDEEGS